MNLTRRQFLKGSAASFLLTACGFWSYDNWLKPSAEASEQELAEHIAFTFHQEHCGGFCHLKCTVRDGRIVLIEPNTWPDNYMSTICVKGISEVQHIYSQERIQTPMRRVGERGEGKFEPISWEEAFDTIEEKLKKLQTQYGKDTVLLCQSPETGFPYLASILCARTDDKRGVDTGLGNGVHPAVNDHEPDIFQQHALGQSEIRDWVNSKLIINVGSNPLESSMIDARYFFDAQDKGAKTVCIDPHFTTTASKSDWWLPIQAGTDTPLFLTMIQLILNNHWYDEQFVKSYTSLPFLVDPESGLLLRQNGPRQEKWKKGMPLNPFMVLNEDGSVGAYDAINSHPVLDAETKYNGKYYQTVFRALKESTKKYTLEWSSNKTQLSKTDIQKLTELYAHTKPAILNVGLGGGDKWSDADITGHCMIILGALTGNIGTRGGGAGCYICNYVHYYAKLADWKLAPEFKPAPPAKVECYDLRYHDNNVHAVIALGGTFHTHYGNFTTMAEWLKKLDFIVGVDIYYTSSMNYADIILPACTKFECNEDIGGLRMARGHVMLREKIIEPLFESHTDFQIEQEFARRWGAGASYPASAEELVRYQLDHATDPRLKGINLDTLKEHNGIMRLNVPKEPFYACENKIFNTESGRLQLYYENMIDEDQALPGYEPQNEAYEGSAKEKDYPLQFSQPRTKFHIHAQFCDATWIQQFYEPHLEINPIDAKKRGLKTGDSVDIFNDRGQFRCKCQLSEVVRPKTVRMFEGMWDKYLESGCLQSVSNDARNPRAYKQINGPVVPFNDTLVEVRKV